MDPKGRKRDVPTLYSPHCGYVTGGADKQMLKNFRFVEGTKFLYLYDFGDEWHFTITFIKEVGEITSVPFVVGSRGEAPIQYPLDENGENARMALSCMFNDE